MDKQQISKYYEIFVDGYQEQASDKVRKAYKKMGSWFEEYLACVTEDMFHQAFQFGYEQGLKEANIRKTA